MSGVRTLKALKTAVSAKPPAPALPVGCPAEALLRPIAIADPDSEDVRLLTEWRNRYVSAFLTEFEATEVRTARWLAETVGPDDNRILFMVDDARAGITVGCMGIAFVDWERRRGEVDAVMRGRPAPRGLMSRALQTMIDWACGPLGLAEVGVRVRSDNPAVAFYRKAGFRESRRVPLRRVVQDELVTWVEDDSSTAGEPSLVHMRLG